MRRLGERTCVINVGTELRHIELPGIDDAVRALLVDGCQDIVFDLTYLRRYEPFALVRLAREWDRLAETGCDVHVAAREPRVVTDLERLAGTTRLGAPPDARRRRCARCSPRRSASALRPPRSRPRGPADASRSAIRRFASSIISPSNMAAPRASPCSPARRRRASPPPAPTRRAAA